MTEDFCTALARRTEFLQRAPRKITPVLLLHALATSAFLSRLSFEALATSVGILGGKSVSKQAVAKRFSSCCYGLRWRIEIVFKSWKSHYKVKELPAGSTAQIQTIIYARLLAICIFQTFFDPLATFMFHKYGRSLSLLKFARFITEHASLLTRLVQQCRRPVA